MNLGSIPTKALALAPPSSTMKPTTMDSSELTWTRSWLSDHTTSSRMTLWVSVPTFLLLARGPAVYFLASFLDPLCLCNHLWLQAHLPRLSPSMRSWKERTVDRPPNLPDP